MVFMKLNVVHLEAHYLQMTLKVLMEKSLILKVQELRSSLKEKIFLFLKLERVKIQLT